MTEVVTQLAQQIAAMYEDWEEGRLPSPSSLDVVGVAVRVLRTDVNFDALELAADYLDAYVDASDGKILDTEEHYALAALSAITVALLN